MTKRPLSRNEFEQTKGAQRPPVVAPGGRSRLQERPEGVVARRRSGSLFASDLAVSLRSRRSGSLFASDLAVSLRSHRSGWW
ncbi:hypothetical protein F2Q69_00035424 [Brassica cretica]|uniref:Uncharacterized protein n=1 Tax=Brassica cretica TaxID=69181 RepID=A0A8S9SR42_BRACR|nr:hypothetical protein F2Q69_00035424 [Brassica cretica]